MKKTALFLALLMMITAVLLSCGEKSNEKAQGEETDIVIAKDGKCDYTVVYPDNPSEAEKEAAIYIRAALQAASGADVEIKTDWVKDESEIDPDAKEILVGNTNRQESAAELGGDINVAVSGSKVVVNGKNEISVYYAAGAFVARYINNSENSVVLVPKDLKLKENVKSADGWMLYSIPAMDGVEYGEHAKSVTEAFSPSGTKDGHEYATVQYFTGVQRSEFEGYIKELESYGFVVDSRTSYENRHVVSLFNECAGRQNRYCLTLTEMELSMSISQIVSYDAD